MDERTSTFQLVLMIVAGALAVIGVATFAFFRSDSGKSGAPIVVWGTFPAEAINEVLFDLQGQGTPTGNISYVAKTPDGFDAALVEAIADDVAPDIVILEAGQLFEHSKRVMPIPYEALSRRDLESTFVGASDFAGATGIAALPLLVDPLVLYSNAARFRSAGIAAVPSYWDQVLADTPPLTETGPSRSIARSAIALGEYANVNHAKEIFFAVANQAGAEVFRREVFEAPGEGPSDRFRVVLSGGQDRAAPPGAAALLFYSQFADASKDVYTWNRSLPQAVDRFTAGDLAMYLGFGSERATLREKNPNLPIEIDPIPQSRAASERSTYGRFYAAAIVRTTAHPADAVLAASLLSSPASLRILAEVTGMAPARRALLDSADPSRPDQTSVYASAVMARPMLQPNPTETGKVIERMIGNVSSGRLSANEAIALAQEELELLFGDASASADFTTK